MKWNGRRREREREGTRCGQRSGEIDGASWFEWERTRNLAVKEEVNCGGKLDCKWLLLTAASSPGEWWDLT
jgi:hypothetical protein